MKVVLCLRLTKTNEDKAMKLETTIPFSGFYESIHSSLLDDAQESILHNDHGDIISSELADKFWVAFNYSQALNYYAKEYCEVFAHELGLETLEFKELTSPKYYNYTTDRIFASIDLDEVKSIYKKTDKKLLREEIKNRFTSYSGFISHYPNDLDEWPTDLADWDCNHVGTLLEVYFKQENDDNSYSDLEYNLLDNAHEIAMYAIDHALSQDENKEALRIANIASYLRTRENRMEG